MEQRIALATDVWTGAGINPNWTTAGNWVGNVAPSPGDDLVFPATAANFSPTNDFSSGTTFSSITIQGVNYALSGNPLTLSTGIAATYTTGTSTYQIPTNLAAVVAPITVSAGGILQISGPLSGSAGVNVTGGGTLSLSSGVVETYTGPTTIGTGTFLVVNATVAGVQNNGGVLTGNGTVGGVSTIGGTIFPGEPATSALTLPAPGQLTASSSVSLDSSSNFAVLLDGTSPGNGVTGFSQLIVSSGAVSLGGAKLGPGLGTGFIPTPGDQFTILQNNTGAPIIGTFSGLAEGGALTVGGSLLRISYLGTTGTGNSVVLSGVSATTATRLLPVALPSAPNQPFTLTAQVSGSLGTPTGTIEFFNGSPSAGGTVLASATVTPVNSTTGQATATVSSLGSTGAATVIYALYIPTPTTFTYAGSTSAPISFATTTTLASSSPVGLIGAPVTFTATVTPATANAGTPTGSVEFIADNTNVLGRAPLNPATGQASLTVSSLSIGTHSIVARFLPNPPFQNSTSGALSQSISTAGAVPILTLEPIRNRHGKVVKFAMVATIQPTVNVGIAPTGSVTYFINGRAFSRTIGLTNGSAVIVRPWARLLNRYAYIRYNGSDTYVAAASPQTYMSHRLLTRLAIQAEAGGSRRTSAARLKVVRVHRPR